MAVAHIFAPAVLLTSYALLFLSLSRQLARVAFGSPGANKHTKTPVGSNDQLVALLAAPRLFIQHFDIIRDSRLLYAYYAVSNCSTVDFTV